MYSIEINATQLTSAQAAMRRAKAERSRYLAHLFSAAFAAITRQLQGAGGAARGAARFG